MAESSNKSLVRIIKKLLETNQKSWDSKLKFALWDDRVTDKRSIGTSPFKLVYGTEAIFLFSSFFQWQNSFRKRKMNQMIW